jgi:hypothetical protein
LFSPHAGCLIADPLNQRIAAKANGKLSRFALAYSRQRKTIRNSACVMYIIEPRICPIDFRRIPHLDFVKNIDRQFWPRGRTMLSRQEILPYGRAAIGIPRRNFSPGTGK